MPSREVVFFDDLSEEEAKRAGIVISTLAGVRRVATTPAGFVLSPSVFDGFRSQKEDLSNRLLPWSVEMEMARALDHLGSDVVHILPSPSYHSEISGTYVSGKVALIAEVRKTMMDFLSEEEEDYRKGLEVDRFSLAFLTQEVPPHTASGSIERGQNEGQFHVRALLGLPVDLSSSDRLTIDAEGSIIDRRILSQEKKWIAGEGGIEQVDVENNLRRELKVPSDLLGKLSALGSRLLSKVGPGTYFWYLKDSLFIVWNASLAEREAMESVPLMKEIPSRTTGIFLLSRSLPVKLERAEVQGVFLLPPPQHEVAAEDLVRLSEKLKPKPAIVLVDDRTLGSLASALERGGENLWPMFSLRAQDASEIVGKAENAGLKRSDSLPFWVMTDTPAGLLLLREAASAFDGVFIPIDTLTSKMEEFPQERRFSIALSSIAGVASDIQRSGLLVAIGTSARDRLPDLWKHCVEGGIGILAVEDPLISDALSLWREKET